MLVINGCSSFADTRERTMNWSAQRLYNAAKEALMNGEYDNAVQYYEVLEARYPFGRFAQQAQIDLVYAYYKYGEPESALVAAERFIRLYPRHPHVDYVYYMKGLVNFELDVGFLDEYLPIDRSQRDQGAAVDSFDDFYQLVTRFPDSQYSEDARQRMLYLKNNLAAYEVQVARYYIKRGAYLAAANRARYVIENYPHTPATPEALTVLAKAYKILGMQDLSNSALRVLKLNYPEHNGITEVEETVVKG